MQTLKTAGGKQIGPFSDEEIWTVGLLIFPNKGNYEEDEETIACEPLFQALGKEKISQFRDVFGENTSKQVKKFFESAIIQKLWPVIKENLKMEHLFQSKNKEDSPYEPKINSNFRLSYSKLAIQMQEKF